VSKRVMAQIRLPETVRTSSPIAWDLACGSRTYKPKAGWRLALVAISRAVQPGRNAVAVRNRAASSRPWYCSASGGMVSQASPVNRATMPSTSAVSKARVSRSTSACSAAELGGGAPPAPPMVAGAPGRRGRA
jgi:hypothetical protein